jgi:hypothetical protein
MGYTELSIIYKDFTQRTQSLNAKNRKGSACLAAILRPLREISLRPLREISLRPLREISLRPLREISLRPLREISLRPLREINT